MEKCRYLIEGTQSHYNESGLWATEDITDCDAPIEYPIDIECGPRCPGYDPIIPDDCFNFLDQPVNKKEVK